MTSALSKSWEVRKPAVESRHGVVSSQSRIASEIGARVLAKSGNAIDAAIATSFALGLTEPWMSGIGGGGYMIVRSAGESSAKVIDFGMKSPRKLKTSDYPLSGGKATDLFPWPAVVDNRNVMGAMSIAMPGQVAGMGKAHERFGKLNWNDLLEPAIELAEKGLDVDWYCQLILSNAARDLAKYPMSKKTFLEEDGYAKSSGWTAFASSRCNFDKLAETLKIIANEGAGAFYEGDLAKSIVSDLQEGGGRHTLKDFKEYEAIVEDAEAYTYREHKVFGTPHMTAGPTLRRTLALFEQFPFSGDTPDAAAYAKYATSIRQANAERFETMGDVEHEPAPSCTTHFNVVDAEGNMVAVTQTLLSIFGSRMMLPNSGILMNNGIMWFDPEAGKPNSLAPSKRCLANMCPTLLEHSDGHRFAIGAAGGRKIMPAVAQIASMLLDYHMDLDTAIHTPRLDVSLADKTIVDDTLCDDTVRDLGRYFDDVHVAPRTIYPFNFACPSAVSRKGNINCGVSEVMSPWSDSVSAERFL